MGEAKHRIILKESFSAGKVEVGILLSPSKQTPVRYIIDSIGYALNPRVLFCSCLLFHKRMES